LKRKEQSFCLLFPLCFELFVFDSFRSSFFVFVSGFSSRNSAVVVMMMVMMMMMMQEKRK